MPSAEWTQTNEMI